MSPRGCTLGVVVQAVLVSGWGEAGVDDAPGSIWVVIRELGVVRANPDRVQSETRSAFVAQTPELLIHDLDGNLARDGRWMYYWDAENRLTRVITVAGPSSSFRRVEWKYDAWGRRTRQTSYVLSNGMWQVVEDVKLVNDPVLFGRHIAELNATNNALVRGYIWGLDLSETLDGAGGVGGLLWVRAATGPAAGTHFVRYDGIGNVWNLVSGSTGTETARYEYGPFGEQLRLSGPAARFNPFRFSTKRTEDFTGLVLYEYRAYSPSLGRWLSRDPVEETASANLHAAVDNAAIATLDGYGLSAHRPHTEQPRGPRRPPRRPPSRPRPPIKDIRKCLVTCALETSAVDWLKAKLAGIDICGKLKKWCAEQDELPPPQRVPEASQWYSDDLLKAGEQWTRFIGCVSDCLGGAGWEPSGFALGAGTFECRHEKPISVAIQIPILVKATETWYGMDLDVNVELDKLRIDCRWVPFRECCACRF